VFFLVLVKKLILYKIKLKMEEVKKEEIDDIIVSKKTSVASRYGFKLKIYSHY
jgi:hypothetical protein